MRCIASSLADMRILLFCALTFRVCVCLFVHTKRSVDCTSIRWNRILRYSVRCQNVIRSYKYSPKKRDWTQLHAAQKIYKNDCNKTPTNVRFFLSSSDLTKLVFQRERFLSEEKMFICTHIHFSRALNMQIHIECNTIPSVVFKFQKICLDKSSIKWNVKWFSHIEEVYAQFFFFVLVDCFVLFWIFWFFV